MNIFTFIGRSLNQVDSFVSAGLGACTNIATLAEVATGSMLEEQRIESRKRLESLEREPLPDKS